MPRSLILEPTRELAAQVAENFKTYGKNHKLSMALLIGGVSFDEQFKKLDRGVDVLIATPGRLIDHFERGRVMLGGVKILVIDEADRMMDMGFIPDVEKIISMVSPIRQTLFFSATMAPEIRRLADKFLSNPKEISVAPPASPAALVTQGLVVVPHVPKEKRAALRALLRSEDVKNALVFCNRKRDVNTLYRSLVKHGFNAAALHGDMDQSSRTEALQKFKDGEITIMVCSDVAARGIDIQGLSHVFNFDVPTHAEDYVHRIGRTGRAGMSGRAFTLATPEDKKYVRGIQHLIGKEIPPVEIEGAEPGVLKDAPDRSRRRHKRSKADDDADKAEAKSPDTSADEPRDETRDKPRDTSRESGRRGKSGRRGRDREDSDQDKEPVVGWGNHVPAFFRIPIPTESSAE
jgi:superfamily II DNA/RNA helicase